MKLTKGWLLLSVLLVTCAQSAHDPVTQDAHGVGISYDYSEPQHVTDLKQECDRRSGQADTFEDRYFLENCSGVTYSGDGGTVRQAVIVRVDPQHENEIFQLVDWDIVLGVHRLTGIVDGNAPSFSDPCRFLAEIAHKGERYVSYYSRIVKNVEDATNLTGVDFCVTTVRNAEIEVIRHIRSLGPFVFEASLDGNGAGSASVALLFNTDRPVEAQDVYEAVELALEGIFDHECTVTKGFSCTLVPRFDYTIEVSLTFYGQDGIGYASHWNRVVVEISNLPKPHADSFSESALRIGMPITSIRRWPDASLAPTGGYQSLDRDPNFAEFRRVLAERIIDELA